MWIRSQNKDTLIKVNDIIVISYIEEENLYEIHNGYHGFGVYKTKERALEVLDEIQKLITFEDEREFTYEQLDLILKRNMLDKVYEMPKE